MAKLTRGLLRPSAGPTAPKADTRLRGLVRHSESAAVKPAASLNTAERKKLASEGAALPDGTFPIRNGEDLHKALKRAHQGGDPQSKIKSHIRKRANALGLAKQLPSGY